MKKIISFSMFLMTLFFIMFFYTADAEAASTKWDNKLSYTSTVNASVDTNTVYPGCSYSIKIKNTGYDCGYVEKAFQVKPNTHYKASVMVKYEGYLLKSNATYNSGASIGAPGEYSSILYQGNEWEELSYEFTTGDVTTYSIALWNGMFCADCKGTAYFSNFRLEEYQGEPDNQWNVMVLFLNKVSAPVSINGKNYTFTASFSKSDDEYLEKVIERICVSVPALSDNLWGFKGIDFYTSDKIVTALEDMGQCYCIDFNNYVVSGELDRIIAEAKEYGRVYNQIIVVSPLYGEVSSQWLGLGGTTYKGINIVQLNKKPGEKTYDFDGSYRESAFVHEMLHCVNRISSEINPQKTVLLHENVGIYANDYTTVMNGLDGWGAWQSDYMRCETPDNKGVVPEAFLVYNSQDYITVYGKEKETGKENSKIDIQGALINVAQKKLYTGKNVTPQIKLTYKGRELTENTDYEVSYINNKEVGKAGIIVKGKGDYVGTLCTTFDIVPKTPVYTMKNGEAVFTFNPKSSGADYYEVYLSDSAGNFYLADTISNYARSIDLSEYKNSTVMFVACKDIYPGKITSVETYKAKIQ